MITDPYLAEFAITNHLDEDCKSSIHSTQKYLLATILTNIFSSKKTSCFYSGDILRIPGIIFRFDGRLFTNVIRDYET